MGFGAQPSRHIYAIPENEKLVTVLLSSPSEETVDQKLHDTKLKEKQAAGAPDTLILLGIEKKVDDINAKVTRCMTPSAEIIPASMKTAVQNSFPCRICLKKSLDESQMVALCCQAITECETFVAAWFGNDEVKDCTNCRTGRALAKTDIRGLEEFFSKVRSDFQVTEERSSSG